MFSESTELQPDPAFIEFLRELGALTTQTRLSNLIKTSGRDRVTLVAGGAKVTLIAQPNGTVTTDKSFDKRLGSQTRPLTSKQFKALANAIRNYK